MARFLRPFFPALRQVLLSRRVLAAGALFFAAGLLLPLLLRPAFPAGGEHPGAALVTSFALNLAGFAALLAVLFGVPDGAKNAGRNGAPWQSTSAWVAAASLSALGFLGLALSPGGGQSGGLAFHAVLWLLSASQAAVVAGGHALLSVLCGPWRVLARQATLLTLALACTALFWTRAPIQALSSAARASETQAGEGEPHAAKSLPENATTILSDGVMKLSPPVSLSGAWHPRFDLVRAPLTYQVWIGSYRVLPYAELWPSLRRDSGSEGRSTQFVPGLLLAMLAWALPLLILCDVLNMKRKT